MARAHSILVHRKVETRIVYVSFSQCCISNQFLSFRLDSILWFFKERIGQVETRHSVVENTFFFQSSPSWYRKRFKASVAHEIIRSNSLRAITDNEIFLCAVLVPFYSNIVLSGWNSIRLKWYKNQIFSSHQNQPKRSAVSIRCS